MIWKEAAKLLKKEKIELHGYGRDKEFYLVGGVPLHLICDGNGTKISCTCRHCSVYHNDYLCSFKVALTEYLFLTKGKEERKNGRRTN